MLVQYFYEMDNPAYLEVKSQLVKLMLLHPNLMPNARPSRILVQFLIDKYRLGSISDTIASNFFGNWKTDRPPWD